MTGIGSRPNLYPGQSDLAGRTDFEHGRLFKQMKAILAIAFTEAIVFYALFLLPH